MRRFLLAHIALATTLMASAAAAQNVQSFVAANATGTTCTRTAPCASFNAAYGKTNIGGEIVCLDSGDFLQLVIDHSITVDCTATNGIVIDLPILISGTAATDVVVLKGLSRGQSGVNSNGGPPNGMIKFTGAGMLRVENVTINISRGNLYSGIYFQPSGPAKLIVADSSINSIGTAGTAAGIYIKPGSGVTADVSIERSRIDGNFFGIIADGTSGGIIRGIVSDSFVTNNVNNGITVATTGSNVVLTVDNTKVSGNNFGLVANGSNSGMLVRRSIINGNATGLFASSGGVLLSYKDNSLNGNFTTDGAFTGAVNTQ
jgi:hypothetical protein